MTPESEITNQPPVPEVPPPAPDTGYNLTPGEQMNLQALAQAVVTSKLTVYNLNAALEIALAEVKTTEARFDGAHAFLANSHGMGAYRMMPDFSRIEPPKGN